MNPPNTMPIPNATPTPPVPSPAAPKPPRRHRRYLRWLLGLTTIGAIFGLAIVAVLGFIDRPAQGSGPSLTATRASLAPTTTPPATNQLSGSYIQFAYPGAFDSVAQVKTDTQAFEQYTIGAASNYRHQITVDVRPLPSGSLADDASYQLRANDPADYTLVPDHIGAEPIVTMVKSDHREQTLFWPHQAKLLTISIASSDPADNLAAILAIIERSARWLR